jgi:hypothetical protein
MRLASSPQASHFPSEALTEYVSVEPWRLSCRFRAVPLDTGRCEEIREGEAPAEPLGGKLLIRTAGASPSQSRRRRGNSFTTPLLIHCLQDTAVN